ncbi:MAG: thioredoxin domain-containing protein [Thermoplasmata archaeon]
MGEHTDIRWREWGEEAFKEARETGKPVLLDLSAVWCHWCHVMDETSYSDDEIIQLINEDFVPIRVDIDKRPDIRERYNFGGYPTTAFLDADGGVVAGGTYIPPDQMKRTLMQVKSYFEETDGKPREKKAPQESVVHPAKGPLRLDVVEEVLGFLLQQFDELYGGFGGAPKFPNSDAVDLALYQFKVSGNRYFSRLVEKTLGAMAGGGIYDQVEGGFFRYSVTKDWSVPHYEKMLDVNAGLLKNYLNAYALLKEPWYREVAEDVLRYLEDHLRDAKGGFFGSQDADEEYYQASKEERASLVQPYIDTTLYADLNGQAATSYLLARAVLGEERYLAAAVSTLRLVEERLLGDDGSVYHYWNGEPGSDGLLGDYVYLAEAFQAAYEHTDKAPFLERSEALVGRMLKDLRDEKGLLLDRKPREEDIGLLKMPQRPLLENSHAATLLLKLGDLTEKEEYTEAAKKILEGFSGQYPRYSIFASSYAIAVSVHLKGPLRLVLLGDPEDGMARRMHMDLLRAFEPRRVVQFLRPGSEALRKAKYPADPIPAVYACVGRQCSPPITDDEPMKEVEAFLKRFDS